MSNKDDVRKQVSEFYGEGLKRSEDSRGNGLVQRLQTYDATALQMVPPSVQATSFACGDPLAFAGVEAGQVVLDLGCGTGMDLLIAAGKVGPEGRVIGVDMTDDMLAAARKNMDAAGVENVELRKGVIEELPVEAGEVDWVISNCVINLSPDKEKVFSEIARVLKPGGRISISDMVAEDLPDWVRSSSDLYGSCIAGTIPEAQYLEGLRRSGLEDVGVSERRVFGKAEVRALLGDGNCGCCGGTGKFSDAQMAELEDRVASIKVQGRKSEEKGSHD